MSPQTRHGYVAPRTPITVTEAVRKAKERKNDAWVKFLIIPWHLGRKGRDAVEGATGLVALLDRYCTVDCVMGWDYGEIITREGVLEARKGQP